MDKGHVLLGKAWQRDVDVTHRDKKNIYVFTWKDKRIAMKPMPLSPKQTKEDKSKFIFIYNRGEFFL